MGLDAVNYEAFHQGGLNLLRQQTQALDALIHDLAEHSSEIVEVEPEELVIIWMLQALGVSTHSVIKLAAERDMSIRDCFGIARSVAETAVNVAYISAEGREIAQRAIRHMRQKRWRDIKRTGRIGDLTISAERVLDLTIDDMPGLAEALAEFTDKKGREIRDWTPESIEKRIEIIGYTCKNAARALSAGIFTIYRPSSELLHGTYYGVNYFWQGSRERPAISRSEFDTLWIEDHFVTLMSTILFSISGAIQTLSQTRRLSKDHLNRQNEIISKIEQLTKIISADVPSGEHRFDPSL